MNPSNRRASDRKPKRHLDHLWEDRLVQFKLKRQACADIGVEFPWQTLEALVYDVEQAAAVAESNAIMADIEREAREYAAVLEQGTHAQELVRFMSREIAEVNFITAEEVFGVEEGFSAEELGETVFLPAWSGMHVTSRP